MDDYNVNVLSEAKNEYSSRLVTILSPLMIEGVKSIFDEACKLCLDNDENEKYLMTFQNFLSRVPKWNSNIIDEEIRELIDGCYQDAKKILEEKTETLHLMAEALIKYETINVEQIKEIMSGKETSPPDDWDDSEPGEGEEVQDVEVSKGSGSSPLGGPANQH